MTRRETRVPMADGVELAATLWLPDPAKGPQPCLLEALPYRKDDLTSSYADEYERLRDEYDYAVCRVDLRGTGSSGGDAVDEYPPQEQADLVELIGWLAEQEWCNGNVGMWGTSYSGFNSLQVACERPPALKAICSIFASDDRYNDDVHYRGGALKLLDLVDYCHYMTAMCALPPVPAVWGDGWREEWRRRVETVEPWLLTWLTERADGPYWQRGSLRSDYTRIECPVMLVAGWADGYRNISFRTLAALRDAGIPTRMIAGPWAHASPASAMPGPRIDLVPEMVAWWDRWLRGREDTGVDVDLHSVFVRSSTRPAPDLEHHEGFWIREEWPTPRVSQRLLELDPRPPHRGRADTGTDAWIDCAGHLPWGQSGDQRLDDTCSLTWDRDAEGMVLMGQPVLRLRLESDQPVASVSVKLCDVFADATSALVCRGSRALRDLEPGEVHDVEVVLDACAYSFDAGQRLRLSVTSSDWPNTVAPPAPVTLTVHGAVLELPLWAGPSPHQPPIFRPGSPTSNESPDGVTWRIERDVVTRETAAVIDHGDTYAIPHDGEASERYRGRVSVDTRTFAQRAEGDVDYTLRWIGIVAVTRSRMDLRIGPDAYDVTIALEAREDGPGHETIGERRWQVRLPR